MWNFSKESIHQSFPFTSISIIFQYIVKILDLQPHLVWTFCHWILPVNFLDLNMSSEKLWVHSSILPPTQNQQCQPSRSIQGAVVRFPNCHECPEASGLGNLTSIHPNTIFLLPGGYCDHGDHHRRHDCPNKKIPLAGHFRNRGSKDQLGMIKRVTSS